MVKKTTYLDEKYFRLIFSIYIYKDLKKGSLLKKIRNHSKPLKLQQNKNLSQIYITGRL